VALIFLDNTAPPLNDKIVDSKGMLTDLWRQWFGRMPATLAAIPSVLNVVNLSAQAASLSATDFSNTSLLPGIYRASYRVQITQAATTSSSLTVSFSWTDDGVVQTATGTAITGNTTTTGQSDFVLIKVDAGTAVQYSATYASVPATAMQYNATFSLEKLKESTS
jgi:hypothetical protein